MAERVIAAELAQRLEIGTGLTLVQIAWSPFVIPIRMMLSAANVTYRTLDLQYWDRRPEIELTGGAYYAVPTLVDGDRTPPVAVYESRDDTVEVARYVDAKLGPALFPPEREGLNQILIGYGEGQIEEVGFRLDDIYQLPAIPDLAERGMAIRHKERKFGKGCLAQWRAQEDQLKTRLGELLAPLEQMLSQQPFLLGDRPVYADYALPVCWATTCTLATTRCLLTSPTCGAAVREAAIRTVEFIGWHWDHILSDRGACSSACEGGSRLRRLGQAARLSARGVS